MRLANIAAAVLALAGTASAATLTVGPNATHTTIASAEAAAVDGDTIVITKGRYYENVTVDVPNLKIVGKGAILDGNVAGTNADCLLITSAGVTVTGLSFRNGTNHIESSGGTLTLVKCTFIDSNSHTVNVTGGDGLTMTGCKFYGSGGTSLTSAGADAVVVQKCTSRATDSSAFTVANSDNSRFEGNTIIWVEDAYGVRVNPGNNAKALKNKVTGADEEGVWITGSDAEVAGNTILYVNDSFGIYVSGTSPLITKNKITDVGGGIECVGTGAEVTFNKIVDVQGYYGIDLNADGMVVRGNSAATGTSDASGFYLRSQTGTGGGTIENLKCSNFIDAGYYLESIQNVTVRNCSAVNCGSEDEWGIYVDGSDNVLEKLTVAGIDGIGIELNSGDDNVFTACSVKNLNGDGFRVDAGNNNSFTNCTAAACGSDGFDNRGTNTALTGGKYRGDSHDIVNDVGGGDTITLTGVNYLTGGDDVTSTDD